MRTSSKRTFASYILLLFILAGFSVLNACQSQPPGDNAGFIQPEVSSGDDSAGHLASEAIVPTPFPTRPVYAPGELVDYVAQPGDTLPVLAERFYTTVGEILEANTFIPPDATTMPPGMPMKIPVYYRPLWGPSNKIIPDSQFINGPAHIMFNTSEFISGHPGWLNGYYAYASGARRSAGEIIDLVARNYSVSPRLLLALVEYQAAGLSEPVIDPDLAEYPLGYRIYDHKGLYLQLNWAANYLNNQYYAWRQGQILEILLRNGRTERFDPWLNAATVALHIYFNYQYTEDQYYRAIAHDGFAGLFTDLYGNPWLDEQAHLPGSLVQPELILPMELGEVWAYTGGPHSGWGIGEPKAALDFAPPSQAGSCETAESWAVAVAEGLIVRSEEGQVMIDMDGDGDERTGWTIFYLHIATVDRVPLGTYVQRGDPVGHPSCEGGRSTGSHIHIARKYNGEWIPAEGVLAFNMEGWIAHNGSDSYRGTMTRGNQTIIANSSANNTSFIRREWR